jgi:predicted RNA-binding Zn ribbon-like protein
VYAVAGSSGKISGGTLNHPAMFISLNALGSMVLDVNGGQLDAKFLTDTGTVADSFTMIKGAVANTPPTVSMTSPANGAAFTAPATVSLAANAADADGTVVRVDFYQGTTLLFSDTTAPYAYSWTNVAAGTYSLTARAVDNLGAVTASSAVSITVTAPQAVTFIAKGATWRYLDNGSNQGTAWRGVGFNDAAWKVGAAELGYGDGGEATVVSYGPSSNNKYVTTYFRTTFNVADLNAFNTVQLNLLRDDGAVVYVNGVEAVRSNMPSGTIGYLTLASSAVNGGNETTYFPFTVPKTALVAGTNTIAVEVHQNARNSSDLSFNLELRGLP